MYPEDVDGFIKNRERNWFPDPEGGAWWGFQWGSINILTLGIWGKIFGTKCYYPIVYSKNGSRNIEKISRKIEKTFKALSIENPGEVLFVIDGMLIFTNTHLHYSLSRDKSFMATLKDNSIGSYQLSDIKSIQVGKKSFAEMQSIKVNDEIIGAISFTKQERLIDLLKCIQVSLRG